MKSNLSLVISLIALGISILMFFNTHKLKKEMGHSSKSKNSKHEEVEHDDEHEELAEYMMRLQWYSNKLYFSGINGNDELTEFYLEELEEVMEEVVHERIMEDGKDISSYMNTYGLSQVENLGPTMLGMDSTAFVTQYNLLIESCNSCHVVSDHRYVKIKTPDAPIASNQKFTP